MKWSIYELLHIWTAVVDELIQIDELINSYILHIIFTPHRRYELNKLTSLPMCGFIAQLLENSTGIGEIMGLNPVEALIFSGFFFKIASIGKFTAMIIRHFHSQYRPIKIYIRYIIHTFANWPKYHSLGYFNQGLSSDPLNNFVQFLWWASKFSQISQSRPMCD